MMSLLDDSKNLNTIYGAAPQSDTELKRPDLIKDDPANQSFLKRLLGNPTLQNLAKEYIKGEMASTPEQREQADRDVGFYEAPYNIYKDIASISPEDLQLNLERYVATDMPEAQLEAAQTLGTSAFQDVQMDPRLMEASESGLDRFRKLSESGMTPEMAAAANKIQRGSMADYMSNVAGAERNLSERGMGSSGVSAAMALAANQQMANKQAEQEEALLAQAYKNKLEAMAQDVSGTQKLMEAKASTDLARATGQDRLTATQASLRADTASRNAAAINAANVRQAQNQQRIAEQNVDIANKQQYQNVIGSRKDVADIKKSAAEGMAETASNVATATANRSKQRQGQQAALQGAAANIIGDIGKEALSNFAPSVSDFISSLF